MYSLHLFSTKISLYSHSVRKGIFSFYVPKIMHWKPRYTKIQMYPDLYNTAKYSKYLIVIQLCMLTLASFCALPMAKHLKRKLKILQLKTMAQIVTDFCFTSKSRSEFGDNDSKTCITGAGRRFLLLISRVLSPCCGYQYEMIMLSNYLGF